MCAIFCQFLKFSHLSKNPPKSIKALLSQIVQNCPFEIFWVRQCNTTSSGSLVSTFPESPSPSSNKHHPAEEAAFTLEIHVIKMTLYGLLAVFSF